MNRAAFRSIVTLRKAFFYRKFRRQEGSSRAKEKSRHSNFRHSLVFDQTGAQRSRPRHRTEDSQGRGAGPARGVREVRTGPRRNPLVGPVSTEKGVPGDGDALLIISASLYFVI